MSMEIAAPVPSAPAVRTAGAPPARTAYELVAMMTAAGASELALTATAAWLSGERRQSDHTQAGYIGDLSRWVAWCQARGLRFTDVPATEADLFAAGMRDGGLANATRARRLSAVSSWFAYLVRAGTSPLNPFGEGMERPKQSKVSKTRGMSEDELDRMLAYARERESPRTYAVLATMAATACRVSSVTGAELEGIGHDKGYSVIDLPVKGGETKRFVMPAMMIEANDRWLAERGQAPGLLYVTASGRGLDQPAVFRMVRRVAGKAGLPQADQLSPHGIRHTILTMLHERNYPTHVIQDLAGHADSRTTRRYDLGREGLDRSPANELGAILAAGISRYAAAFRR